MNFAANAVDGVGGELDPTGWIIFGDGREKADNADLHEVLAVKVFSLDRACAPMDEAKVICGMNCGFGKNDVMIHIVLPKRVYKSIETAVTGDVSSFAMRRKYAFRRWKWA